MCLYVEQLPLKRRFPRNLQVFLAASPFSFLLNTSHGLPLPTPRKIESYPGGVTHLGHQYFDIINMRKLDKVKS